MVVPAAVEDLLVARSRIGRTGDRALARDCRGRLYGPGIVVGGVKAARRMIICVPFICLKSLMTDFVEAIFDRTNSIAHKIPQVCKLYICI